VQQPQTALLSLGMDGTVPIHQLSLMQSLKSCKNTPLVGMLVGLLSACAGPSPVAETSTLHPVLRHDTAIEALSTPVDRSRIALDMVNVLMQVNGYTPEGIKIDVTRLQGLLGESVERVLSAKGYRSAPPSAGEGVPVEVLARNGASDTRVTVDFSAGRINLKRGYRFERAGVQPASPMFILGAPAGEIVPDDSIFVSRGSAEDISDELLAQIDAAKRSTAVLTPVGIEVQSNTLQSEQQPDQSGDASILQRYRWHERKLLVFGNDSLRLGTRNKRQLAELAGQFTIDTDLLSVVGCSQETTNSVGSNAQLAQGRTYRITEELVAFGVPVSHIYDEACWSASSVSGELPKRGAVVILMRKSRFTG